MKTKRNPSAFWNKELAQLWTRNIPPNRPSPSEIVIYTKYLRQRQAMFPNRKIKLLILGSSSDFRDWAYQENMDVTIVDCSEEYYNTIKREMRYKHPDEKLIVKLWQDMDFENEFDLIVGDLVIGNLYPDEIPSFLKKISEALLDGGFFMTKSFFRNENNPIKSYEEILLEYYKEGTTYHPYSKLIYDIAMCHVNKENGFLDFNYMYKQTLKMHESGIMDKETFEKFRHLGWEKEMKFFFYIPTFKQWEDWVNQYLIIYKKEYGEDLYSKDFPIYIITTKSNNEHIVDEKSKKMEVIE